MSCCRVIRYMLLFMSCVCISVDGLQAQDMKLFSSQTKQLFPEAVCDFLERYLWEMNNPSGNQDISRQLLDDGVYFNKGHPESALSITEKNPFSLTRTDDRVYNAVWTDSTGMEILDMTFPVSYELILGKSKNVIEKELHGELTECSTSWKPVLRTDSLYRTADGIMATFGAEEYYMKAVNTSCYYYEKDSVHVPVFERKHLWYSAANLFQGIIDNVDRYRLYIEQNLYGFKTDNYTVSLAQWLNYCSKRGCIVYFAVEEEHYDGLKVLLIARCRDFNFNHVLSIIIPDTFTEKRDAVLKATLNAYIPTQNVLDLYKQYSEKK